MAMMKIKTAILLIAALGLVAGAARSLVRRSLRSRRRTPPAAKRQAETGRKNEPQARLDDYGDPLPDGVVRRVGTLRFRHGGGRVNFLIVSPDGKTLISGTFSGDRKIRARDLATGKLLHSFPGTFAFRQIALSPDGTTLAESHENDVIHLWDVATGKELRRLEWKGCQPYSVAFSPDGKTLVSGAITGFLDFWDLEKGKHTDAEKRATVSAPNWPIAPTARLWPQKVGRTRLPYGTWDRVRRFACPKCRTLVRSLSRPTAPFSPQPATTRTTTRRVPSAFST